MKKIMKISLGVIMSAMLLFAFAGCGGGSEEAAAPPTPAEEAAAALDTTLSALKSADMDAIAAVSGGDDVFADATESFGSEEGTQTVLKALFGHFDYTIGTPEQVDDSNVNVPVTVSNANMTKATDEWFSGLMSYALENPEIANDQDALQAKTIEMLESAVEKTAGEEDGIVTKDVVFPMTLKDGTWAISDTIDDDVLDAILGGFMGAVSKLTGGTE